MDANGTRYQLLLGEDDWWVRCTDESGTPLHRVEDSAASGSARKAPVRGLQWSPERSELTLRPRISQFTPAQKDVRPPLEGRRGAARDRYDNWYWIDETARRVLVKSEGTRVTSTFWPPEGGAQACEPPPGADDFRPRDAAAPPPSRFAGLAVTEDHYLVVGVLDQPGILYFDLHAGGAPRQVLWPAGVPFEPFDMTAAPGGGVFILDRAHRNYWALDRQFNVRLEGQQLVTLWPEAKDDFQPRGGSAPERRTAARLFPDKTAPRLAASDPVAIDALPDGTVMILDRNPGDSFCRLFHYRYDELLSEPGSTDSMADLIEGAGGAEFGLSGFDLAFVSAPSGADVLGRVYVVSESGNQTFAFTATEKKDESAASGRRLRLVPLPDFLPMRLFGGKALARSDARLFYDYGDGWIPLVEQRRPRYALEATLLTPNAAADASGDAAPGAARFHAFDGREPNCVWHRLMLDACIPPEAEVRVYSRAADTERELAYAEWQPEPHLYARGDGSEIPFAPEPAEAGYKTWELLFQRARGRYLQLKLVLTGSGRTTPRLRALRAYYPRFSYLENYLPAVYRQDAQSSSFLDRYLSNFEGIFTAVEDRVAAAQALFDVRSAPAEALAWLAGWFGVALDPTWDEFRRRLFIKHAMRFFQMRGTARGVRTALRLALEDCPSEEIFDAAGDDDRLRHGGIRIVEHFRTRRTPGVVFGDPTDPRGLGAVQRTARWLPVQGGAALHDRYREALRAALGERRPTPFPVRDPGGRRLPFWRRFALEVLGFVPAAADEERKLWWSFLKCRYASVRRFNREHGTRWRYLSRVPLPAAVQTGTKLFKDWAEFVAAAPNARRKLWQDYLARRYRSVAALNEAHGARWPSFELVPLPDALPADGRALLDWYQFEGVVLPMRQSAHRFTVLLPMPASEKSDLDRQAARLALARRVVGLEKPAHTVFDVRFYWAMFRVGEARLADDTLLDVGSRAPQLMPPAVVGRAQLAESYIAPTHPQDVADRQTLGFERLGG